jgi:hypothetical protein
VRSRVRLRFTYANVTAAVAMVLALGGGVAYATGYVITSNSQVAPDTISGHNPPSGDQSNVIANSLTGQDVQEVSLGTVPNAAKLEGLTSSAFFRSKNVKKVDVNVSNCTGTTACAPTILSVGGGAFTLSFLCAGPTSTNSSGTTNMKLFANLNGSHPDVNWFYLDSQNGGTSSVSNGGQGYGQPLVFDLSTPLAFFESSSAQVEGQIVYRDDTRVVSVAFHGYLSAGAIASPSTACGLQATSTEADA